MVHEKQIVYWDELSKEIETAILNHDPASTYAMIRRLKGGQQNSENSAVQDKNKELDQALEPMKSLKDPDNDDISTDKFKAGELFILKRLHEIFVDIWQNEEIVDQWILAILIRLFDKKCNNYLGISRLVVASKLFTEVILNRIQKLIDK
ncbi:unnamed protein product [Rotaria sp. Silwood1]|nr:unnamed protein product [Rotaria sp. Silwood1]